MLPKIGNWRHDIKEGIGHVLEIFYNKKKINLISKY